MVYSELSTAYSAPYIMYSILCTQYIMYSILCTVYYAQYMCKVLLGH